MAKPNLPVLGLAMAWWLLETSYFGWHAFPTSSQELFADGLALTLAAAAFLCGPKGKRSEARAATPPVEQR